MVPGPSVAKRIEWAVSLALSAQSLAECITQLEAYIGNSVMMVETVPAAAGAGLAERLPQLAGLRLLIVDDNSPDGTGRIADEIAARNPRIHVMHRAGKLGQACDRFIDTTHEPGKITKPCTPGCTQIGNIFEFGFGQIGIGQVPAH